MADPILHIKDSYYFEVPRFMWQYREQTDVPKFLRDAHPDASLEDFQEELNGKILIPQPFGDLQNLYTAKPGNFCISKFMILELLAAVIVAYIFIRLADRMKNGGAPTGRWWNLLEAFLLYIRDEIARPAIGKHDADRFVPLLWTMFFFILGCNLLGMIPWMGAPTGSWGVTFAMACVTFLTILIAGMFRFGVIGFWKNQVPSMDLPLAMAVIIKPLVWAIEIVGLLIKNTVLSIRLLANMVAGHIVLLGIMGMIIDSASLGMGLWGLITTIAVIGSTLFSCLELFVAFLQAYVFTFLSALFIGAAIHHH